jgi:hypothetical protein
VILAFLQNAYTSSEEQARENEEKFADPRYARRHQPLLQEAIATYHQNFTYSVLRRTFGELCREIWWTNASPRWGWRHDHKFPADPVHIRAMITEHQPSVVLAFGRIAADALAKIRAEDGGAWLLLSAPHPAARMPDKMDQLRAMRAAIDEATAVPA